MNILIVGCSEAGTFLARKLESLGQDVSVLEEDSAKLEHLHDFGHIPFQGMSYAGVPIDIDDLRTAGIEECDVVLALTPDDNVNVMVAQVAKEIFKIEQVYAAIEDPILRGVFSVQFNVVTVSPTELLSKLLIKLIFQETEPTVVPVGKNILSFKTIDVPTKCENVLVSKLSFGAESVLIGLLHQTGEFSLANKAGLKISAGDKAVVSFLDEFNI